MKGFTLIELLVALAILSLGLAAGIGLLRPDPRQPLNAEMERLGLLLEQATEESELSGHPLAWLALENGYAFERQSNGAAGVQWRTLGDDDLLRPRQFPPGFAWDSRSADGAAVGMGERIRLDDRGPLQLEMKLRYGEAHARLTLNNGLATPEFAVMEPAQ